MTQIVQIVGIGLVLTVLVIVMQEQRGDWAELVRIGGGVLMLLFLVAPLIKVVNDVTRIAVLASIPGVYLGLLFKVLGIAYLTTFAARIAYDSGESGIAARLELAGKLFILLLAVPLIASVTDALLKLVPS